MLSLNFVIFKGKLIEASFINDIITEGNIYFTFESPKLAVLKTLMNLHDHMTTNKL